MQQIAVTHGFVKKLARNVRAKYGRDVRHTEIIELVADALGLKAGPLMHALKQAQIPDAHPQSAFESVDENWTGLQLLDKGWKHHAEAVMLTAQQKKFVAFISVPDAPEGLLLIAKGYWSHPEVSSARMLLVRTGHVTPVLTVDLTVVEEANRLFVGGPATREPATRGRSIGTSTRTSSVAAVGNVLTAIRDNDLVTLPLYMGLLAPTSAVSKFVLAYAHRLQAGQDTRTAVVLLLDAFVEEPFFVELAASSVVSNAITDEAFARFQHAFDYGQTLRSEILGGRLFSRKMLAWAANHAIEHEFLAFDGDRAVVKSPPLSPKAYGYNARTPGWSLNDDGLVNDGRETFLRDLCREEVERLARTMDLYWKSPDELDVAPSVAHACERFAREAVVGGAWPLEKVADYVGRTIPRLLAAKYDKPY
jgi:hypothetical protein